MATFILEAALKKRKISKRRFARMLGVRYDNFFRVFRPNYDAKLSFMNECAAALGVKVKSLIKE
jgi:hypothetical protein